ncbi:tetratricopeptide repeat protein [Mycobacterium branderi]|uniref:Tetratricopeptide repeat protein n=1 Tax=Mycobacterium branderi TaxID=43348 RepID=A0A7I7W048_9MYCO|nr:tetratricopeptide repeat protein [Mycobacterium branderi]MCV7233029.1 tetratricopeptide repeat protein [Mycobacterium branderi]ORA41133.1 hypothetical protein BST20_03105 [Mycobacterium branderi]BBZ10135.1 hypothetical protein MBRA_03300 [Mycobacterium branderi]
MTADAAVGGETNEAIHIIRAYIDTRKYERAREIAQRYLSANPNDPDLLAHYAQTELLLKSYASAAQSAYAALSIAPDDELAMRIYALALDGLGRRYDALWVAWRAVIAHPNEPLEHYVYARLLYQGRQLCSALQAIDESLRLDPTYVDALVLRGVILNGLGRIDESTAVYREVLSLDSTNAEAVNNIAVNRLKRGKFRRALRGFLGAAGLDPSLGDLARRNIGLALARATRRLTAIATIVGWTVTSVGNDHSYGEPTAANRVVSGIATTALIVLLARLLREIPRRVLVSVLRDRTIAAARVFHALVAAVCGTWATVFDGSRWIIAPGLMVMFAGLLLFAIGLRTRT